MGKDYWNFSIFRRQYSVMGKTVGAGHSLNPCFPLANHISLGNLSHYLGLSIPFSKMIIMIFHPHRTIFKVKWSYCCHALNTMLSTLCGLLQCHCYYYYHRHHYHHARYYCYLPYALFHCSPTPIPVMFLYKGGVMTAFASTGIWPPVIKVALLGHTIYCCPLKQFLFWEAKLDVEANQGQRQRIFSSSPMEPSEIFKLQKENQAKGKMFNCTLSWLRTSKTDWIWTHCLHTLKV